MPVNALFERPAGGALGSRSLTSDEKDIVRDTAETAWESVLRAREQEAAYTARWLGVLSPTQTYAVRRGVDVIFSALDTRAIEFAAGDPVVPRTLRHGAGIPPRWMTAAASGCFIVAGTFGGNPIRIVLNNRFFSNSPKRMLLTLLHELSHCVLGTADVNWSPLGMAYDVTLSQQLAARYPGWAMQNAENWGFYLSSYTHGWP